MNFNNYDELDILHENAKTLSGGNRWAYLALMIGELTISAIVVIVCKIKRIICFVNITISIMEVCELVHILF